MELSIGALDSRDSLILVIKLVTPTSWYVRYFWTRNNNEHLDETAAAMDEGDVCNIFAMMSVRRSPLRSLSLSRLWSPHGQASDIDFLSGGGGADFSSPYQYDGA